MITTIRAGSFVRFLYKNRKGQTSERRVKFIGLDYGRAGDFQEEQWFLRAEDPVKGQRSFPLSKINTASLCIEGAYNVRD